MGGQSIVISVLADTKKLGSGLNGAGKQVSGLTKGFKNVVAGAAILGAAAGAVFTKLGLDAFKAVRNVEKLDKQTNAVLTSTGSAAGRSLSQLRSMGDALERLTGIEQETVTEGQNMLLTFTNIKGTNFDAATKSALDMSVAMKTDMASASKLVGKALNDPIKGMAALSKVGVQLTADQKALITQMVSTGDVAGAQGVILQELNRQFGGSAAAFGTSFDGMVAKVKNSGGQLIETLVSGLLPAGSKVLGKLDALFLKIGDSPAFAQLVQGVNDFITGLFDADAASGGFLSTIADLAMQFSPLAIIFGALKPVLPQLSSAFGQLTRALGGELKQILPTLSKLAGSLGEALSGALAELLPVMSKNAEIFAGVLAKIPLGDLITKLGGILGPLLETLGPLIGRIAGMIATVLGGALEGAAPTILMLVDNFGLFLEILTPLIDAVMTVVDAFAPLQDVFTELVAELLPPLIDLMLSTSPAFGLILPILRALAPLLADGARKFAEVTKQVLGSGSGFSSLVTGIRNVITPIKSGITSITTAVSNIKTTIKNAMSGATSWLNPSGKNIMQGLTNGMKSWAKNAINSVIGVGKDIVAAFKKHFGIKSPSRLMFSMGQFVIAGLNKALNLGTGVKAAAVALSRKVTDNFAPTLDIGPVPQLAGYGPGAPRSPRPGDPAPASGNTYNVTVHAVAPNAEVGRAVVDAIDEFERLNGAGR